ncbi:hypothetical protein GGD38_005565 [Chitinophagaceae bacterium OAS944]|nr:hypothetical protein [Chitinophagaceae bacterium OAS944]
MNEADSHCKMLLQVTRYRLQGIKNTDAGYLYSSFQGFSSWLAITFRFSPRQRGSW